MSFVGVKCLYFDGVLCCGVICMCVLEFSIVCCVLSVHFVRRMNAMSLFCVLCCSILYAQLARNVSIMVGKNLFIKAMNSQFHINVIFAFCEENSC